MAGTKAGTKADVVREILHKIGAVAETPPEGWKAETEKELKKRKLKVHQTQIYELRRKELAKSCSEFAHRRKCDSLAAELAKAQAASGDTETSTATTAAPKKKRRGGRRKGTKVQELNFDTALKIATFAKTYGGLAKLSGHCQKIMALTGELK